MKILNQNYCMELDNQDQLKAMKDQFILPNAMIYLGGNTLGARPKCSLELAQQFIANEWDAKLVQHLDQTSNSELPLELGNKIARLIGADDTEVMVADSTALNLFKTLAAAIKIQAKNAEQRRLIIAEKNALPTDLHIIQSYVELHQQHYQLELIENIDELANHLETNRVAVVILSHVSACDGYLKDMFEVNQLIHQYGALVIWDLCQSVGTLPIYLNQSQSDFAIGCTYKYLNGGPGAPAFLWVKRDHLNSFWDPINAWNDHNHPFDLIDFYEPSTGVRRYMSAHQPIISMRLIECGLELFSQTNLYNIRTKSLKLTGLFIELMQQECADFGFELMTPTEQQQRGSHLSYCHPFAYEIYQALMARGIIADYRETNTLRFAFAPLYIGYVDVWNTVQQIKAVMQNTEWQIEPYCLVKEVSYQ